MVYDEPRCGLDEGGNGGIPGLDTLLAGVEKGWKGALEKSDTTNQFIGSSPFEGHESQGCVYYEILLYCAVLRLNITYPTHIATGD